MKRILLSLFCAAVAWVPPAQAQSGSVYSIWAPQDPGFAYGFAAYLLRTSGSTGLDLRDFTIAGQLAAVNGPGVNQWAFVVAAEAWALPGPRSIRVAVQS